MIFGNHDFFYYICIVPKYNDMNAPEKIYIGRVFINDLLSEKRNYNDVEYIRKDIVDDMLKSAEDHAYFAGQEKMREALVEWAKSYKEEADATCRNRTDNPSYGQSVAMRDLINQIKSL